MLLMENAIDLVSRLRVLRITIDERPQKPTARIPALDFEATRSRFWPSHLGFLPCQLGELCGRPSSSICTFVMRLSLLAARSPLKQQSDGDCI